MQAPEFIDEARTPAVERLARHNFVVADALMQRLADGR